MLLASIASSSKHRQQQQSTIMTEKEEEVVPSGSTGASGKKVKKKAKENMAKDPRDESENARMDGMFDTIFQGLHLSLASIISESDLVTQRAEPDEELEQERADIEDKLRRDMLYKMKEDADRRLRHIQEVGKATSEQLVEEKRRLKTEETLLREIVTQQYNTAVVRSETIQRRLNMQKQSAERRMRELVFEVIGEYGKSELRMRRRKEYLTYVSTMQHLWMVRKVSWDRFAARLVFESCVSCLPSERRLQPPFCPQRSRGSTTAVRPTCASPLCAA